MQRLLVAKGNYLQFTKPTLKDGKLVAKVENDEVKKLNAMWSNVMYFMGQSLTLDYRFIRACWNLE